MLQLLQQLNVFQDVNSLLQVWMLTKIYGSLSNYHIFLGVQNDTEIYHLMILFNWVYYLLDEQTNVLWKSI